MFKRIAGVALSVAALTVAGTLHAGTIKVKTGLWKTTTTHIRNGQSMPPRSDTRCVTQKDLDDISNVFSKDRMNQNDTCKRSDFKETSNSLHWKYECTGQFQMVAQGDMKFDSPTHYSGKVVTKGNVMGHSIDSETDMVGERVGECTGKENNE